MSEQTIRERLTDAMKAAMRAKDKPRLGTVRLILAAIKQVEVDEQISVDDTRTLAILDKMAKQRRDSFTQYTDAGRDDLAAQEALELDIIQEFLPQPLTADEINELIMQAIAETGAEGMQAMGQLMAVLKPKLQGRADMAEVSKLVKGRLA